MTGKKMAEYGEKELIHKEERRRKLPWWENLDFNRSYELSLLGTSAAALPSTTESHWHGQDPHIPFTHAYLLCSHSPLPTFSTEVEAEKRTLACFRRREAAFDFPWLIVGCELPFPCLLLQGTFLTFRITFSILRRESLFFGLWVHK